jgi:hypothetical protein
MKLELDNDAMKGLIGESILQSFDEQKRDAIIRAAIESLLQPIKDGYSRGKTPLQEAFEAALSFKAREMAREAIEKDSGIQAQIEALIADAQKKFFVEKREAMVDKMADALQRAITGRDY